MSAREQDSINGWVLIKDNPISKVGVFEYSGRQISPQLEPDKIYKVYRPAEELATSECIESFKLIPWTNDHPRTLFNMQADSDTVTEDKEIHGAVGENVYFDGEYLRANIKIFSKQLADEIEAGKKELSVGYKCIPDITSGVYNGVAYDVVQRGIRGNHLALVDEGRSGPDVSVLDHYMITYDTKELNTVDKDKDKMAEDAKACDEGELSLESLKADIVKLTEVVTALTKTKDEAGDMGEKKEIEDTDPMGEKKEEKKQVEDEAGAMGEKKEEAGTAAMDAKLKKVEKELASLKNQGIKALLSEVSQRDTLAKKLSSHVGVFDHADKTLSEVAEYGIKKLNLSAEKGQEIPVLNGFFAACDRNNSHLRAASTMDHKTTNTKSSIDAYLNEGVE